MSCRISVGMSPRKALRTPLLEELQQIYRLHFGVVPDVIAYPGRRTNLRKSLRLDLSPDSSNDKTQANACAVRRSSDLAPARVAIELREYTV